MIKKEHGNLVSIKRACELCKVSRSGYYRWFRRPEKRSVDVLGQKVKRIFQKSRKTYGTRRIKKQLAVEGVVASRQRISHKMAEQGLVAKARRKTRATTDSNHDHPVAPNLLADNFLCTLRIRYGLRILHILQRAKAGYILQSFLTYIAGR